jgi:hypothetical protein
VSVRVEVQGGFARLGRDSVQIKADRIPTRGDRKMKDL